MNAISKHDKTVLYFSNETAVVVITPPVDGSLADQELPISVQFPGFDVINTGKIFTYKGNPTLTSVEPLEGNIM